MASIQERERWRELAGEIRTPLAQAMSLAADGLSQQDGETLLAATTIFEQLGHDLLAAETATAAAHSSKDVAERLGLATATVNNNLERLRGRLGQRGLRISLASLSNWQTGKSRPERAESLHVVHALEELLGLAPESLVVLLGPPRRRGRWAGRQPAGASFREMTQIHPSIDLLASQIEAGFDGALWWRSVHENITIGPAYAEQAARTRIVFEALSDGIDRHVVYHHNERGAIPQVQGTGFCRQGRTRVDTAAAVCAVELLFDHPLVRGETYVVEYEFGYPCDPPHATTYQRWFRFPTQDYLLQVQFHPEATPIRCYRTWQPNIAVARADCEPLRLTRWNTVHFAEQDVRPGVHGIRWEWD